MCRYDFEYMYYPATSTIDPATFFVGVIVSRREPSVIFFDRDMVYEVVCMDGRIRLFCPWEIEVLHRAAIP